MGHGVLGGDLGDSAVLRSDLGGRKIRMCAKVGSIRGRGDGSTSLWCQIAGWIGYCSIRYENSS